MTLSILIYAFELLFDHQTINLQEPFHAHKQLLMIFSDNSYE